MDICCQSSFALRDSRHKTCQGGGAVPYDEVGRGIAFQILGEEGFE